MPCHPCARCPPAGRASGKALEAVLLLGKTPDASETGDRAAAPNPYANVVTTRSRSRKCLKSRDRRLFTRIFRLRQGAGKTAGGSGRRPEMFLQRRCHNIPVAKSKGRRGEAVGSAPSVRDILVDFTNPLDIYVGDVCRTISATTLPHSTSCGCSAGSSGVGGDAIAIRLAADRHATVFRPPSRRSAGANGVPSVRTRQ